MITDENEVPKTLNEPTPVTLNDVEYRFSLSPFDFPIAYRTAYDKATDSFVVRFRYVGDEPDEVTESSVDDRVKLKLGKETGNLHEVAIHRIGQGKGSVTIALQRAVDALQSHSVNAIERQAKFPSYRNPEVLSRFFADNSAKWHREIQSLLSQSSA